MMQLLYNFFIGLLSVAIRFASLFNSKAKDFRIGRKNFKEQLESLSKTGKDKILIHCASLGEFEQVRPLLEMIRKEDPELFIHLTFFSPSGYEVRKNYAHADLITYLPLDTKSNANLLLDQGNYRFIIFVKYEFWFNLLQSIKQRNIPCFLVSGILWESQQFFKWYGKWFAKQLSSFTHFFVQNKTTASLLKSIGYQNVSISGDGRFDRVVELSKQYFESKEIEKMIGKNPCLILGSAWQKEIEFTRKFVNKGCRFKVIIAPHVIDQKEIDQILSDFPNSCRLSRMESESSKEEIQTIVVDQIGILSKLYRYGTIAFIGGGFGSGVHNTLEASVYGCPVIFGPNYERFQEIKDLIEIGSGFSVHNYEEFEQLLTHDLVGEQLTTASVKAKDYVISKAGASNYICSYLQKNKLLG